MAGQTQMEAVYGRITEPTGQAGSLTEAVRQVAQETDKTQNAVRALRFKYTGSGKLVSLMLVRSRSQLGARFLSPGSSGNS